MADNLLVPVAERYAAYLIDVDEPACWVLAANPQFPRPSDQQVITAAEGPLVLLRPAPGEDDDAELRALAGGRLSDELVERGLPGEHRLVLVVPLAGVADEAAAAAAVEALAARVFARPAEP